MAAHTCALGVALLLVLAGVTFADTKPETKEKWSRPVQEAEGRSDWIPVSPPFRDSDVSAQEEVATVLRPPDFFGREQRLIQSPRQGRGSPGPQPYFPGDQSHLIRFPNEPAPQLRVPNPPPPPPTQFRNPPPVFLQPQPVPAGFPPPNLAHPPFQPQPIPVFNNNPPPPPAPRPQQNSTFVNADPDEEVQLLYVPLEALKGNNIPSKQKGQPTKQLKNNGGLSFEDQLRQFVKQQGSVLPQVPNPQAAFEQEQQRLAVLKEQEERRRIQEQELRQRVEQEQRIRKEHEERLRKEQEQRARKEQEQRERKEQELRERQEQEARARKEQELRLKQEKEAKEQEERARYEASLRFQQQPNFNRRPQFAAQTSLQAQEHAFQQQLQNQAVPEPSTTPKPHQPPLAVYMGASNRVPASIDDVLFALRNAETIPVIDRVPDAQNPPPQVFVGPAEMKAPEGFTKFELPYLSSLESNRVERKVDDLPFFVAPLSFNPPQGYNKIPFPAPHVGSVVVSKGGRQVRPLNPDPEQIPEEYTSEELPSISPAIPLLVNSLQNGRGSKAQRPHVQQQFLSQDQFVPNIPQFVPQQHFVQQPPPQHHVRQHQTQHVTPAHIPEQHVPQHVPQHVRQHVTPQHHVPQQHVQPQQQQFEPQQQQFQPEQQQFQPQEPHLVPEQFEEETVPPTTEPPTTTTPAATRRPLHSRGRTRQQIESTAAPQRTRTRVSNEGTAERRPVNRGRRPVARQRTTTTTPEPVTEQENLDSSNEATQQQQQIPAASPPPAQPLVGTPAPQHFSPEPQFVQPQFQHFEPSGFDFQQRPFPTHQQGQGIHALPVQPAAPQFEEPAIRHPVPANHAPFSRGQFQQQQFEAPAEQEAANFETQRFEAPKKVGPVRHQETPQRQRVRPQEVPAAEEQPFQRSRPAVFQPIVSTTPETLTRHSVTPHTPVTSTAYPSESLSITPHHVVKGEVGKVQHNFPFVPTPLPDLPAHTEAVPTASIQPEYQFNPEPEVVSTAAPVEEEAVSHTTSPTYQTPTRSRVRQEQAETQEPAVTTPRSRVRVSDSSEQSTPAYHSSQRFRGRGSSSREETSDEVTSPAPPQRVRTRVHSGRVRQTTERPGLQITVADIPSRQQTAASTEDGEAPQRTRGRFRGVERGRGTAARQQQLTRGRQPSRQQENAGIDLPKPVRQQINTDSPVTNDSPVYVPDVQFESGFVPSLDSQKSLPTSTEATSDTTTTRPPGRRFNNFGTGNRVAPRRPHARGSTTTTASQDSATEAPTSPPGRAYNTVRTSRRQQQQQQQQTGNRVTSLRGSARIRRPNTTPAPDTDEGHVKLETGVTYIKNPYVTIHRAPEAGANDVPQEKEQAAPVTNVRQQRPEAEAPATRYTAEPAAARYTPEPEYDPQYYSSSPAPPRPSHNQGQFFVESTPTPQHQFSTRSSTVQPDQFQRVTPQQYQEDVDYQPRRQQSRQRGSPPGRYITLDDPEDPEYGEESQRSEQISIQQLEGALTASLYNKEIVGDDVESADESSSEIPSEQVESQEVEEEEPVTEENEQVTTENALPTTLDVEETTTAAAELEQVTGKPALHAKPNEGRRRRVRIRTRKQRPGDVFETAESQNVATINILNDKQNHEKDVIKNEWKLSPPYSPTIDISDIDDNTHYESDVVFTTNADVATTTEAMTDVPTTSTPTSSTTTPAPTTASITETSTIPPSESTTSEAAQTTTTTTTTTTTSSPQEATTVTPEVATTTEIVPETPVTPRVLGTSTTTEISLETEICYRGRCVKTKVDADQLPIEK